MLACSAVLFVITMTEISKKHCFYLVHVFYKYVLALEIFVDDSARMEVSDSISRLSRDLNYL